MFENFTIGIGSVTLDRLSKLPWSEVSSDLSADGSESASQIYDLLKVSADLGKWDLFREAMEIIPDGCTKHVIEDSFMGCEIFVSAIRDKRDVPSDILLSLIRRLPSIRECKGRNTGDTLLHVLCKIPNPPEFVGECIDEFANYRVKREAMQNNDGDTPLHYAIECSNLGIIEKMTQAFPEMVTMKNNHICQTPLHVLFENGFERREEGLNMTSAIETQVKADASVLKLQDTMGDNPVHVYFEANRLGRCDEIMAMLKADPSAARCLNYDQETPIHKLLSHNCENWRISWHDLMTKVPAEFKRDTFGDYWRSLLMLLLAATKGCFTKPRMNSKHDECWTELGAVVELGKLVPWQLFCIVAWEHFGHPEKPDADGMLPSHFAARAPIQWNAIPCILNVFPDSVKVQDLRGRLPLHIAAACKYHEDDEDTIEGRNVTNITRLVSAYPRGAETKTKFGSFPLHLAIRSGKHWRPDVKCILEAAPQVLSKPDPCSRLYPFMQAAVGESASGNVVYELLRRDPSLVEIGILESENEKYLERRICDMANEVSEIKNKVGEMENRLEDCICTRAADLRERKRPKKHS